MKEFQYTIKDSIGIHARPAGMLAKKAKEYSSEIIIHSGEKSVDARKLMMLMGMGIKCGDSITVTVSGSDEDAAAEDMKRIFEENL